MRVSTAVVLSVMLLGCRDDSPIDADGDSFTADVDCNDGDAEVNANAAESCNGVDGKRSDQAALCPPHSLVRAVNRSSYLSRWQQ